MISYIGGIIWNFLMNVHSVYSWTVQTTRIGQNFDQTKIYLIEWCHIFCWNFFDEALENRDYKILGLSIVGINSDLTICWILLRKHEFCFFSTKRRKSKGINVKVDHIQCYDGTMPRAIIMQCIMDIKMMITLSRLILEICKLIMIIRTNNRT